ncbi:MAG: hypothetical protein M3N95_17980 [Actinomycetota bacterium]|nr:hypothetical protein [Actinomycetota bacterium]
MDTESDPAIYPVSREVRELYIAKINNAIGEGRESLVSSLVADYDQHARALSASADRRTSAGQAA